MFADSHKKQDISVDQEYFEISSEEKFFIKIFLCEDEDVKEAIVW